MTYHGIALNVTTDLADFELIDACGMTGITVTSIARELGWSGERGSPSTGQRARRRATGSPTRFERPPGRGGRRRARRLATRCTPA